MRLYLKRKGLIVKRKNSDIVVKLVNAGLAWDLDFNENKEA
mgnify:FL=1